MVWRGFRDRACGMPLVALALNLGWEAVAVFVYPSHGWVEVPFFPGGGISERTGMAIWFVCDLALLATWLRYSYPKVSRHYGLSRPAWAALTVLAFGASLLFMLVAWPFLGGLQPYFNGSTYEGGAFIAFIQNAIMSALFVQRLLLERDSRGQSFNIALLKLIGTPLSIGWLYVYERGQAATVVAVLVALILILDVLYAALIYRQLRRDGLNPWTRL